MQIWPFNKINSVLVRWLTKDIAREELPASDFTRICYEIRPCDVLLVEGHSRVSEVIKLMTKSNWSHSALYIGRFQDIQDNKLRQKVLDHYRGDLNEHLVIEGILGKGTVVSPLSNYKNDHVRICRPSSIHLEDAAKVIAFAINHLGTHYNIRHIFDLLRLLFPITIIPRYLFSSIFKPYTQEPTKEICSALVARAFGSVGYPILPKIVRDKDGHVQFVPRNPNLFTPKDFDYSPYFNIIKYPFYGLENFGSYRHIPWVMDGSFSNDQRGIKKLGMPRELQEKMAKRAEKLKQDLENNNDK